MNTKTLTLMAIFLILLATPLARADITKVAVISVFVTDLDKAKNWYTQKLGFILAEDSQFGPAPSDRWLTVRAKNDPSLRILLRLGKPVGHQIDHPELPEVIFDSMTDDLIKTAAELKSRGVRFAVEPTHTPWGVFEAMVIDQDGQGIAIAEGK